jgi:sarcosine oxidase subunit alpha
MIRSKRHGRLRSPKDLEVGLPYTEIIYNGHRISYEEYKNLKPEGIPLPKIPYKALHTDLARNDNILRIYSKILNNPEKIIDKPKYKNIRKFDVDNLVIGCGTSGLYALKSLTESKLNTVAICSEELGDVKYDSSEHPFINKKILISELKNIFKYNQEKIIKGFFLGKFSEGLVFETENEYLIVSVKNRLIIATGARFIPPLFEGNDLPGIISKNMFLRYKDKYKKILILGSTNEALKTALNSHDVVILYKKDTEMFSAYYKELVQEKGYEIVPINTMKVERIGKSLYVTTDSGEWLVDAVVYSIVKQPRIEVSNNIGIDYLFYDLLHIYIPKHNFYGESSFNNYILIGGARGISDEYISQLSGEIIGNLYKIDEFKYNFPKHEEYLYKLFNNNWESINSPYLLGRNGYVCECEDILFSDIIEKVNEGYRSVEELKRLTGITTGHCQGKLCSFLIGSIIKSPRLITYRSPLLRLIA